MNLLDWLRHPESKTLEFKRDLSSPEGTMRTIVAFANTGGGTLLIGVEDRTRHVRGVGDPLALEERLANLISDQIAPRLVPDIDLLPWRNTHVVAVQVHASALRPHYLKRAGAEAGVFVRVGSTNRRADPELIRELQRLVRGESFDEQAMPELNSDAIDVRVASESFVPVRKLKPADLDTLRLVTRHQGRKVPTVGGYLLFGKQRALHFPDAWIQAGRFRGEDRSQIIDNKQIRDPLVQAVTAAIEFVQNHLDRAAEIGAVRRTDRWMLPAVAIREAVINAVVHADYSQRGAPIRLAVFDDRVEFENPGLLPFGLTIDDLRQGVSRLRNRVIGRVFHELGLIEQWGSGIQRMSAACHEAGLPAPAFEEVGMRFRVTLRTTPSHAPATDEIDQAILTALARGDGWSTGQLAAETQRSARATRIRLKKLVLRGLVREVGTSPEDPKRRYFAGNGGA